MKELTIQLNKIDGAYYDFIVAVLNYTGKKKSRYDAVKSFMGDNPSASPSDILKFISMQDDFGEDAAYMQKAV